MIRLVNALIWRYRQKLLHTSDVGKPCQRDYKKHFIGKLPHRRRQGQKEVLIVVVVVTRKEETSLLLFMLVSLLSRSNRPFSPTCFAYEVKSCLGSIWTCGRVEVMARSIECCNKDICSLLSSPRLIKSCINWVRRVACVGDSNCIYSCNFCGKAWRGLTSYQDQWGYRTQTVLGNRDRWFDVNTFGSR